MKQQYFTWQYSLMLTIHSYEKDFFCNKLKNFSEMGNKCNVESLAQVWPKRYLQKVQLDTNEKKTLSPLNLIDEANSSDEQALEYYSNPR